MTREKEGSYMGRWIRGPGTGDPSDSWKEKRKAWVREVMEEGVARRAPAWAPCPPQVSRPTSPSAFGKGGN